MFYLQAEINIYLSIYIHKTTLCHQIKHCQQNDELHQCLLQIPSKLKWQDHLVLKYMIYYGSFKQNHFPILSKHFINDLFRLLKLVSHINAVDLQRESFLQLVQYEEGRWCIIKIQLVSKLSIAELQHYLKLILKIGYFCF